MKKICLLLAVLSISSSTFARYRGFLWEQNYRSNNCYNYALGIQTDTFQQPGRASGRTFESATCGDSGHMMGIITAAKNDGLRYVQSVNDCRYYENVVAVAVNPRNDYHWYRLEDNGTWTHKPGDRLPINKDSSGNIIRDVRTADRGNYRDFCGYFCVNYDDLYVK